MTNKYPICPLLFLTTLFFFNNCASTNSGNSGTEVDSNQGVITISDLRSDAGNVEQPAFFVVSPDSLFIEYPQRCWDYKIDGTVELFMDINENGESTNTKVTRGIGGGCDEAAWSTMNDSKYNPALDPENNPVSARHFVTVVFKR